MLRMGTEFIDYRECQVVFVNGRSLKVGTTVTDPSVLSISKEEDGYYKIS